MIVMDRNAIRGSCLTTDSLSGITRQMKWPWILNGGIMIRCLN